MSLEYWKIRCVNTYRGITLTVCVCGWAYISIKEVFSHQVRASLTGSGRNSCSFASNYSNLTRCALRWFFRCWQDQAGGEGELGGEVGSGGSKWYRISLLYAMPESNQSWAKWEPSVRCCWLFQWSWGRCGGRCLGKGVREGGVDGSRVAEAKNE